jgi:hypothetical protein
MKTKTDNSEIKYKVVIKKVQDVILTLQLGLFLIVWLFITTPLTYGVISTLRFDMFTLSDSFFLLVGLYVIDQFLWQVNGKEVIILTDLLEIHKLGKLLKMKTFIKLSKIDSISYSEDNQTNYFLKTYFYKGGNIRIMTSDNCIRLGQNIPSNLAKKIVSELEEEIKKINVNY